ncbi:MAG: TIGR02996 domain-containing protein [Myxococcota bacterium]|nr:TIGR02996 domain-containing protein [Deltaproteobacteria bacterium]MDQ3337769.1 TIGR02996 domain-containing protein [Myxococcota bacterium]
MDDAEASLLRAIAGHDEASRLVYADWLESNGRVAHAEFVRLQQALVGPAPTDDAGRARFKRRSDRLRALAETLDPAWRVAVARPLVENCDAHFDFACPMEWGQLTETRDAAVRACKLCEEPVYYCTSIMEARTHAFQNRCVAVDITVERQPNDLVRIQKRGRMIVTPRVTDDD